MSVRCIACANLTMTLPGGLAVQLPGCGLCLIRRPMGTHCVHVGLTQERECPDHKAVLPEVVVEREQAEAQRQLDRTVRRHLGVMTQIVGREARAAYLVEAEAADGAAVRRELEQAFKVVWAERQEARRQQQGAEVPPGDQA